MGGVLNPIFRVGLFGLCWIIKGKSKTYNQEKSTLLVIVGQRLRHFFDTIISKIAMH